MPNYRRFYLQQYNYIFFTLVTENRKNILFDNINLLRQSFKYAMSRYSFELYGIVVLDNHLHFILKLNDINTFPKIIRDIKYYFSIHTSTRYDISKSKLKKGEKGIWQRRFYDHVIRDENDLYKHLDYIHFNPIKHQYVNKTKEFPYSSFKKFVKLGYYDESWCNADDKYLITNLELE